MEAEEVKQIYNQAVANKENYEANRWFKNKIQAAGFVMTRRQILKYCGPIEFSTCLEIGPGQGTWTSVLMENHSESSLDLVDISREMLDLCQNRFKNHKNIRYFANDFLKFIPDKKYDFVFSARALEYIPDKDLAIKKIAKILNPSGVGFIITKTPKYWRKKFLGIEVPELHQGQITPKKLKTLMERHGLVDLEFYPVTTSFPVINFAKTNMFLFTLFKESKLNFFNQLFCESYGVKFKKI